MNVILGNGSKASVFIVAADKSDIEDAEIQIKGMLPQIMRLYTQTTNMIYDTLLESFSEDKAEKMIKAAIDLGIYMSRNRSR